MIEVYLQNSIALWTLVILNFILFYMMSRKQIVNIGDPLWFCILSSSTGCAIMLVMMRYDSNTINALLLNYSFFVAIFLLSSANVKLNIFLRGATKVELMRTACAGITAVFLNLCFTLGLLLSEIPAELRLEYAAQNRVIDVLSRASTAYFFFCCGMFWPFLILRYRKITITCIVIIALASFMNGSKGALLNAAFTFTLGSGLVNRIKIKKIHALLLLLAAFSFVMATIYINSITIIDQSFGLSFIESVLFRMLAQGESYYYLMLYNGFDVIFGAYSFFDYLFHPIYKFFGYQGYEYPLGVLLQSIDTGRVDVKTGPNASLPILLMSISNGSFQLAYILLLLYAYILIFFRRKMLRAFFGVKQRYRLTAQMFVAFYIAPLFFLDLGVGMQLLIGTVILEAVFWFYTNLTALKASA